jgi:hypothetical protein
MASTICFTPLPINLLNGASGVNVAAVSAASGNTFNAFCIREAVFDSTFHLPVLLQ